MDTDPTHHADGFCAGLSGDAGGAVRGGTAWVAGVVPPGGGEGAAAGALSGGGHGASGAGGADGGAFGPASRDSAAGGPGFDAQVKPGGYAWWYVDAFSDDGRFGLTIIAFVGSVFSPYYAWAGRKDPGNHCAVNVALYGEIERWAMTERGAGTLRRSPGSYALGASRLAWDGRGLDIEIDETCVPWPSRLKGRVRLEAEGVNTRAFALAAQGGHVWRPIAPLARVRVEMERPACSWSGFGYFDQNYGDEPLEDAFTAWSWSRARTPHGARVFYEAERRREGPLSLSLAFGPEGTPRVVAPPPVAALPRSRWGLKRATRSEGAASLVQGLEDAPFYARARISHMLEGVEAVSMHERLDLTRFARGAVKAMLPFRMPRWG